MAWINNSCGNCQVNSIHPTLLTRCKMRRTIFLLTSNTASNIGVPESCFRHTNEDKRFHLQNVQTKNVRMAACKMPVVDMRKQVFQHDVQDFGVHSGIPRFSWQTRSHQYSYNLFASGREVPFSVPGLEYNRSHDWWLHYFGWSALINRGVVPLFPFFFRHYFKDFEIYSKARRIA